MTAWCRMLGVGLMSLLLSSAAAGDQPPMRVSRLTMQDGLSQSAVMQIAQDQAGFMWFATENGLDRYDGIHFISHRRERGNDAALLSDFVRALTLDGDGHLWIATDGGGVARRRPDAQGFESFRHDARNPASLASDRVRAILADARGWIWVGTRDAGLDRLDPATGEVRHYRHDPDDPASLTNDQIYALALDGERGLWIATRSGLNRLDFADDRMTRFRHRPGDPTSLGDDDVRSLLVDRSGTLWVGTRGAGLCRLDAASGTFRHFRHDEKDPRSLSSNHIHVVFEDDRGRLWIGTDNGLNLMLDEAGAFVTYRHDPADTSSLSSNHVVSIFQDAGGVMWIGTRTGGLNKWNPRSWSFGHFDPAARSDGSFSNPNVTAITKDRDGRVWIGTFGGGINVMDRASGTIRQLRHDPEDPGSLSDDRVMTLMTDSQGDVWAGTMTAGLNRIDPAGGTLRRYRHDPEDPASLAVDGIMSLLEDSKGRIWVGTFGGGVSMLDDATGRFVNHGHDPDHAASLSNNRATSIAEDANGVIWVGTDGGGINWMNPGSGEWRHLRNDPDDPSSLGSDAVYAVHPGSGGDIWVGTRFGLERITGVSTMPETLHFAPVSLGRGMSNNAVYSIKSDDSGTLWLSTNRGLTRYNPATGFARDFHENQGLQGEEFNYGAAHASDDGELFFGGPNGFNAFYPEALEFNDTPPPVVLSSLSILNRPLSSDIPYERIDSLDLDFTDDVVTFEVAALDYAAPDKNRYAYKLDGFDDAWVEAGNQRRITYTNLDGGDYVLRIKAANSDGAWNETGLALPIRVAYPYWKTWWAYALYVLSMAGAVFAFWRHQQNKLLREAEYSQRLEHEVRDRTKELKARNADLKEVNGKLLEASITDPLTGLRNRRYLFDQISKDVDLVLRHYRDGTETIRPGGNNDLLFLMVDLDHFKPVNDSCGHEAGDEMLLQVRDVLIDACRYSDDVIRWGGDEFLVVARETNRAFAARLAERIRENLANRVFALGNGQVVRTTVSIGFASYPFIKDQPDLLNWEEVLGVADAAMFEAKQRRNAWIGIDGIEWSESGDELYRAIRNDPGKLAEEGAIQAIESLEDAAEQTG